MNYIFIGCSDEKKGYNILEFGTIDFSVCRDILGEAIFECNTTGNKIVRIEKTRPKSWRKEAINNQQILVVFACQTANWTLYEKSKGTRLIYSLFPAILFIRGTRCTFDVSRTWFDKNQLVCSYLPTQVSVDRASMMPLSCLKQVCLLL